MLRQKKVSKEKATLGRRPLRGFPALLDAGGGCGTRPCGPQTVLALLPPTSALLGASQGARKNIRAQPTNFDFGHFFGSTVAFQFSSCCPSPDAFRVPLRGAEQRSGWRKKGEDCLRAKPEFRSPRQRRVAQGTGAAGADLGVAFFLATFSWRSKKKYARASSAENTASENYRRIRGKKRRLPSLHARRVAVLFWSRPSGSFFPPADVIPGVLPALVGVLCRH